MVKRYSVSLMGTSHRVDEPDEPLDIDRLDRAAGRDRQRLGDVGMLEHHVTAARFADIHPSRRRDRLQAGNPPVPRVGPHRRESLAAPGHIQSSLWVPYSIIGGIAQDTAGG